MLTPFLFLAVVSQQAPPPAVSEEEQRVRDAWNKIFANYPCNVLVDLQGAPLPPQDDQGRPMTYLLDDSGDYARLATLLGRDVVSVKEGHVWSRQDRFALWHNFSPDQATTNALANLDPSLLRRLATELVSWAEIPTDLQACLVALMPTSPLLQQAYFEGSGLTVSLTLDLSLSTDTGQTFTFLPPVFTKENPKELTPITQNVSLPPLPPDFQPLASEAVDMGNGSCTTWGELVDRLWRDHQIYFRIDGRMRNDLIYVKGVWTRDGFLEAANRQKPQLSLMFYDHVAAREEAQANLDAIFDKLAALLPESEQEVIRRLRSGATITTEEFYSIYPEARGYTRYPEGATFTLAGSITVVVSGTPEPNGSARTTAQTLGYYRKTQ